MEYSHQGKRNFLILDGQETGVIDKRYDAVCPFCQSVERYSVKDITDNLPNTLSGYIVSEKVVTEINNGREVKKGIPAYGISHSCQGCKRSLLITATILISSSTASRSMAKV